MSRCSRRRQAEGERFILAASSALDSRPSCCKALRILISVSSSNDMQFSSSIFHIQRIFHQFYPVRYQEIVKNYATPALSFDSRPPRPETTRKDTINAYRRTQG